MQNKCGKKHLGIPLIALAAPLISVPVRSLQTGLCLKYDWRSRCPFYSLFKLGLPFPYREF